MDENDLWKEISRHRELVSKIGERIVKLETIIEEKDKGSTRKTALTAAIVSGIVSATMAALILAIQMSFKF